MTSGGAVDAPRAEDPLASARRVFLDTAPVIYFVEGSATYAAALDGFFHRLDAAKVEAITSPVTLAECLIHPLRAGNSSLASRFTDLLTRGPGVRFIVPGATTANRAAELRARFNVTLTDAFQLAIAEASGCDVFLTNDADLRRISLPKPNVILVDDLVSRGSPTPP